MNRSSGSPEQQEATRNPQPDEGASPLVASRLIGTSESRRDGDDLKSRLRHSAACGSTSRAQEVNVPAKQLKEFLNSHRVKYVTMTHSTAYTAQEIASLAHIMGEEFAKTV